MPIEDIQTKGDLKRFIQQTLAEPGNPTPPPSANVALPVVFTGPSTVGAPGMTVESTTTEAAVALNPASTGPTYVISADDSTNGFRIHRDGVEVLRMDNNNNLVLASGSMDGSEITANTITDTQVQDGSIETGLTDLAGRVYSEGWTNQPSGTQLTAAHTMISGRFYETHVYMTVQNFDLGDNIRADVVYTATHWLTSGNFTQSVFNIVNAGGGITANYTLNDPNDGSFNFRMTPTLDENFKVGIKTRLLGVTA
jgi:hypothetical protein